MAAYQQIVDDIRMLLQMPDQQQLEQVRRLATMYNSICQQTNFRLHGCADLLVKGLRSEAIHQAQGEPVLLDVVAALDFPERRQWEQLCAGLSVPLPQPLKLEAATLLNEAYADDQPLEELLRKHRLLNLGRAPISARLALLRRLVELDPRNVAWEDDVRTFERARLQQLQGSLDGLVQQQNASAVLAAAAELAAPKWRITPPAALVSKAQAAARRFKDDKTLVQLRELEAKLNDAMAACDVTRAVPLRDQWLQLARSKPHPGDPIWNRVNVVLQWVDQQTRRQADEIDFQVALAGLSTALQEAATAEDLEQPYLEVQRFNRGLPDYLQDQYQTTSQRLRRAARQRQLLRIGGPILAVLLLAGGLAWWLNRRAEVGRQATATEALHDFLEAGQVAEAKAYIAQLEQSDPALAQSAELQALRARLQVAEKDEIQRRQAFAEALKAASAADLDEAGERAVQRASDLAVLPEEKVALQQLRRQRQASKAERQQDLEKALTRKADELARKIDELEATLKQAYDSTAVAKSLTETWNAAHELLRQAAAVDPEIKERIQALFDRVQTARDSVERSNSEALALSDLTFSLESRGAAAYGAALERYVSRFPDTPRAQEFKRVLAEKDLWSAAFAWQGLLNLLPSQALDVKTAEAGKLAEPFRQYIKDHPRSPNLPIAESYSKALLLMSQRNENDPKSVAADFRKVFATLTVKDVWYLRTEDGKVFYSTDNLQKKVQDQTSGFVPFEYLITYDGKTRSTSRRVVTVTASGRSPQSVIAEDASALYGFAERRWEETILTYAKKVREAKDLDPILKTILLRQILECGSRGSYPLAQVLAAHLDEFQNTRVDITVPWMDPDSEAANRQRPLAREFVNLLPPQDKLLATAEAVKQKLAAEVSAQRVVSGWLQRKGNAWTVASYVKLVDRCQLYVIVPGEPEQPSSWHLIGSAERGTATIQASAGEALVEGRLVFSVLSK